MSSMIHVLFDLLVNSIEGLLIYLLLSRKLQFKSNALLILSSFIIQVLAVTCMNQFMSNDSFRMAVTLGINSVIALILSMDSPARSIFWGCTYPVITVLADTLTMVLGHVFIREDWNILMEYPFSIIMTFFYLFICCCCVLLLIRRDTHDFIFPWFIQIFWLMIVIAGIVSSEVLLDLLIQLNDFSAAISRRLFLSILLILAVLFLSIFLFYYIGILYQENLGLIEKNRQKQFEKQQFELLSNTNQMLRTWKHDFMHHLSVLEIMLQQKNIPSALDYLNSIHAEMKQSSWQIQTGNNVLDAVLTSKLSRLQSLGIAFTHNIFLPDLLPLNNLELTSLMGNLLENAIEACSSQDPDSKKYIHLEIKPYNQFLYIDMTNSSSGIYHYDHNNRMRSTKRSSSHGIGLKRIEQITSEAQGFMKISPEKDSFHIIIVLPLQDKQFIEGDQHEA